MRRVARIEDDRPAESRRTHRAPHKVSWTPRERRLKHAVPLMYRIGRSEEWLPGTSENISRSGLLFRAPVTVADGSSIQIKLEMPKELTGEKPAEVVCRASVARVTHVEATDKDAESYLVACSIDDYEFGNKPMSRAVTPINAKVLKRKANG